MAREARVSGRMYPSAVHAFAALALLADTALRVRRARHARVRVALGAVADILREEDLRQIDHGVLESDVGELARRDQPPWSALGKSFKQPSEVDLVNHVRKLD